MSRTSIITRPCPVCGAECEVRFTQKGKPYWQCDPCGVQVFVRRQAGIERFNRGRGRDRDPTDAQDEEFWG